MRAHPHTRGARASALLLAVAAMVCCLAPLRAARAQASATLSGTVADETGAVIPGAEIIIANPATGLQRRLVTDGEGHFSFPLLPPARYDVRVERAGFAPVEIRGAELGAGDHRAYRVLLKIVGFSELVLVEDQSLLDGAGAVATVIEQRLVENLPLAGRTLQPLLELVPGSVTTRASFGEQGQFSVNGQRANANYFTVDGVSANFGVSAGTAPGQAAAGSLPALTAHGGTNSLVSADALQEMRVQSSSYAPEWGRSPGAQISLITRAGTNEFHGTASEYFRHDMLSAADWFANSRTLNDRPHLRQNQFGATLGGPVSRDRAFFFASYEGLRLRQPRIAITEVPSMEARGMAPASLRPFLGAFPGPTSRPSAGALAVSTVSYSDTSLFDAFSLRLDAYVGGRVHVFGRYSRMDSEDLQRGRGFVLGTSELSLNTVGHTSVRTETLTAGAVWSVSPRLSNDVRVNRSRARGGTSFTMDDFGAAQPLGLAGLLPAGAGADSVFLFRLRGGLNASFALGRNADNKQRQFNVVDHLTFNGGAHQLKLGADYRLLSPIYDPAGYVQRVTFPSALAVGNNEDLDRPRASEVLIAAGGSPRLPLFTNFSAFAQDTWRAGERLTLTYGVRWELSPPPREKTGQPPLNIIVRADANINVQGEPTLAPAGTGLWATTYTNFAPRLAVAYQLRPGAATVLRGGVGIYYDAGGGQAAQVFGSVPPYTSVRRLNGVSFPLDPAESSPDELPADAPFDTAYAFDYGLRMPYSVQWNVSVEQPVGARQVVGVAYVGAAGRRLFRQTLLPPSGIFREVRLTTNSASSDYHSLQVRFQRRLPGRLHAVSSYTWARSVDDVSADSEIAASFARSELPPRRSASDFDVRHSASGALSYDLPALNFPILGALSCGWSLDTIFRARTAAPVNVFVGRTLLSGELIELSSPFVRHGVPLVLEDPAAPGGRRINRGAFQPSASQAGTPLERNSLRGFGMWQADVSLRRRLALTGHVKLQLRVDIFNVFNHPNFGDPVTDLGSGLFGQSVQMLGASLGSGGVNGGLSPVYQFGGPRAAQLVARLEF